MKLKGFDMEKMTLAKLDENSLAFKNSKLLFLTDIPLMFKGLPSVKFNTRYHNKYIKFELNTPQYVYVAVGSHYPNPLPDFFENMQDMLQIVEIKSSAKPINVLTTYLNNFINLILV